MERRLQDAALKGSVTSLILLLQEDELILDRAMVAFATNSPLHIALKLGHVDFAKEILSRKPEMATEADVRRSSPLHLASAKGYTEIVRELLGIDADICLDRDQDGKTPLHLAAIKGHVDVLGKLVEAKPIATRILLDRRETILHLCVKHNHLEALKLLVDSIADKQTETIKFLVSSTGVEVNALNANGFTAFDVIPQSPREAKDMEIIGLLRGAGGFRARDIPSGAIRDRDSFPVRHDQVQAQTLLSQLKNQNTEKWLKKKQNALMVVASLIATMAFQAGIYPPSGVWQDDSQAHGEHIAGFAIWADHQPMSNNVGSDHINCNSLLTISNGADTSSCQKASFRVYSGIYLLDMVGLDGSSSLGEVGFA
ncbi:hypothetical protein HHK36_014348 [Tetracentron sinense]|uniref:PGG domain-containing protein n=1 Tax=Tetracentron sinense TaxID=13715 RepID=A0A834Z5X5_TETSI|nr:hypothetical protein HHK36_014348 [Tetracentron sinense]